MKFSSNLNIDKRGGKTNDIKLIKIYEYSGGEVIIP
jgi:hypothetical protein